MLKNFEKLIVLRKTIFQIISWEYDLVINKQDSKNQGFTIRWPSSYPLSMRWLKHKDDTIIHGKSERRVVLPVRCWRTLRWWNLDSFNMFLTYLNSTMWRERGKKREEGSDEVRWAGKPWLDETLIQPTFV